MVLNLSNQLKNLYYNLYLNIQCQSKKFIAFLMLVLKLEKVWKLYRSSIQPWSGLEAGPRWVRLA